MKLIHLIAAFSVCIVAVLNEETATCKPERHFEDFFMITVLVYCYGTFTIVEKCMDSEGGIWYMMIVENQGGITRYNIVKMGEAEDTTEIAFIINKFPGELDPDFMLYRTFIQRDELP